MTLETEANEVVCGKFIDVTTLHLATTKCMLEMNENENRSMHSYAGVAAPEPTNPATTIEPSEQPYCCQRGCSGRYSQALTTSLSWSSARLIGFLLAACSPAESHLPPRGTSCMVGFPPSTGACSVPTMTRRSAPDFADSLRLVTRRTRPASKAPRSVPVMSRISTIFGRRCSANLDVVPVVVGRSSSPAFIGSCDSFEGVDLLSPGLEAVRV